MAVPRSHLRVLIKDQSGDAIQNALVFVYLHGTTTAISDMWTLQTGGAKVVSLVSSNTGLIEAWLDLPRLVDLKITDNSDTAYLANSTGGPLSWDDATSTIDVDPDPSDIAVLSRDQTFLGHNTFAGAVTITDVVTGLELSDNVPLQTHKPGVGIVKTLLTDSTFINFGDQTGRSLGINFFTSGVSRATIDNAGTTHLGTTTIAGTGSATALTITPPLAPTGSSSPFVGSVAGGGVTIGFVTTPQTGTYSGWKKSQNTLTNPSAGTIPDAIGVWAVGGPIASTNVTTTRNYAQYVGSTLPASGSGSFGLAISSDFSTGGLWLSASANSTTSAAGMVFGLSQDASIFRSASSQITLHAGTVIDVGNFQVDSTGRIGLTSSVVTDRMIATGTHPGTATTLYGAFFLQTLPSTTTAAGYAYYGGTRTAAAAFTLAAGRVFYAAAPIVGAGSAITSQYGFYIENQGNAGITNSYGGHIIGQTGSTTLNVGLRIDASTTAALWLGGGGTATDVTGGIAFGSGRDVTIFRSAASTLNLMANWQVDSSGRVGQGGAANTAIMQYFSGTHPSGQSSGLYGIDIGYTIPSTMTGTTVLYAAFPVTAAASFTVGTVQNFQSGASTIGASSAITTHQGFFSNNLGKAGITNAYGFYGTAQSGAATLNVTARFDTGTTAALWLGGDTTATDVTGGIAFGSGRDVTIFRSGSNALTLHATTSVTFDGALLISKPVTLTWDGANVDNNLTWRHSNTAYRGTLGVQSGGGHPFVGLHAEHSSTANTWKNDGITRGGVIAQGSQASGAMSFLFGDSATADAVWGTPVEPLRILGGDANAAIQVGVSMANWIKLQGGGTGVSPNIFASGSDTGVGLKMVMRGAGVFSGGGTTGIALSVNSLGQVGILGQGAASTDRALNIGGAHGGTATALYGIVLNPTFPATTTVSAYSLYAQTVLAASTTIKSTAASFVAAPTIGASSAITQHMGYWAANQGNALATNSYGLRVDAQSGSATGSYGARIDTATTACLWLGGDTTSTTVAGGLTFGSGKDVSIFRSGSNALTITATAGVTARIAPRVETLTDAATVTPAGDANDGGKLLTLSQTTQIANPTGTPTAFQGYKLRIKSASAQSLTWGSQFRGGTDISLPTTTSGGSKTDYLSFMWNSDDSKWDLVGLARGY